jgi:NADH:ubiquinone oxidoreductase subunit 6 (subunit J)
MNDTFDKIEELTIHVKEYVNTSIESAKIQLVEKSSLVAGNVIAVIIVAVLFLFVITFGSFAGAYALSEWLGKPYWGFVIVAGFYLLLAVIVWFGRQKLIRFPILNAIIKQVYKKHEEDKK